MKRLYLVLLLLLVSAGISRAADTPDETPRLSFAWGAEAGASIDLSGNDMSDFAFDATFGMKRSWIKYLGVGVAADFAIAGSRRSYPIYINFHTDFSKRRRLCFWAVKAGVSLNYLENNKQQTGPYAFTGLGINLAGSKKFNSYLLMGYTFRKLSNYTDAEGETVKVPSLHYATVRIGVTF